MTRQFQKTVLLLTVFLAFSIRANNGLRLSGEPRAVISYNAEKSGSAEIIYDTSFFIFDLSMEESDKQALIKEIMAADNAFKKLELSPVNGVKDMMVIVDVRAKNLKDLSKKMKALFTKLKVNQVDYNGAIVTTETFSF
ncbi:MAG: hypothetical protein ACJ76F_04210 [Bacteroidia bacterium]